MKIKFMQEGGMVEEQPTETMPVEQGAPTEDPMMQIVQVAQQALQNQDCEAMAAVCQALLQLAQGGGAPQEAPAEEPTYARRGAKLVRVR